MNFFTSDSQEELFFGGYSPRLEVEYSIVEITNVPAPVINSIEMNGEQLNLSWKQYGGFRYILESSDDCKAWTPVSEFVATADAPLNHTIQASERFRFYRLRRESE